MHPCPNQLEQPEVENHVNHVVASLLADEASLMAEACPSWLEQRGTVQCWTRGKCIGDIEHLED